MRKPHLDKQMTEHMQPQESLRDFTWNQVLEHNRTSFETLNSLRQ